MNAQNVPTPHDNKALKHVSVYVQTEQCSFKVKVFSALWQFRMVPMVLHGFLQAVVTDFSPSPDPKGKKIQPSRKVCLSKKYSNKAIQREKRVSENNKQIF